MTFYTQYGVSTQSQRYIKKVWCLDNFDGEKDLSEKSVLPNGCQNIAIVHGLGINVCTKKSQYQLNSGTYLSGQMTSRVKVTIREFTRVILIQLHPWTLSSLVGIDGFTDEVRAIDEYFLGRGIPLNHSIASCPKMLGKTIDKNFEKLKIVNVDGFIQQICLQAMASGGESKVANILDSYEFSTRKIQTTFKKSIGLSIKQYMDIVRLRSAVDSVNKYRKDLGGGAAIAANHQYTDQSHLVKSFKKIVKLTPSKFDRNKFIMPPNTP